MTTPTPTLPAGDCGKCPTASGGYCVACWDSMNGTRRRRVLAWRDARDGATSKPTAATPAKAEPARSTTSRLVCREHHTPVTPRGKGCTACTNPHPRRRKARPMPDRNASHDRQAA